MILVANIARGCVAIRIFHTIDIARSRCARTGKAATAFNLPTSIDDVGRIGTGRDHWSTGLRGFVTSGAGRAMQVAGAKVPADFFIGIALVGRARQNKIEFTLATLRLCIHSRGELSQFSVRQSPQSLYVAACN